MLEELNQAFTKYRKKWEQLVNDRTDKSFFQGLKPTAIAWKTEDLAEFDRRFRELRELSDQIHLGWINERWLGTFHLKDSSLQDSIRLVKLMQRRPGSSDAVGLDHVDFYSSQVEGAETILKAEPGLKWSPEDNGHCHWLSIWFADTEAKLRTGTTVDVCIQELQDVNKSLGLDG